MLTQQRATVRTALTSGMGRVKEVYYGFTGPLFTLQLARAMDTSGCQNDAFGHQACFLSAFSLANLDVSPFPTMSFSLALRRPRCPWTLTYQ